MRIAFPRLYVILDQAQIKGSPVEWAMRLAGAGVELIQLRDKQGTAKAVFANAKEIVAGLRPLGACLIVNDRVDIAAMTGAAGVHVGQEDMRPEEARAICGRGRWVGVSTHSLKQVREAARSFADYVAVGPVYATQTKAEADPVVGLELVRQARVATRKPLVAIGGITLERYADVLAAGADCAAVASDILGNADPVGRARQYLQSAG
jgi:thiamine-phosphate pyrophosphorylase